MVDIPLVSARIGRGSGRGIAANLRLFTPKAFPFAIVALLLIANTINIAPDIAAMGEWLQLIVGGGAHFHAVAFNVITLLLQVFVPYRRLAHLLQGMTLSLFGSVAAAFLVNVAVGEGAPRPGAAADRPELGVLHHDRRDPRHDDLALSLFLAGFGTALVFTPIDPMKALY